jgi:hypothetical protein
MESYFELLFCFILNVIAWTRAENKVDFKEFFTGFSNILCSVICIIYGCFLVIFPINGVYIIVKNRSNLEDEEIKDAYYFFYEDLKTKQLKTSLFNMTFLFRRIYTVLILIFLGDYPFFQCELLMIGALSDLIRQVSNKPYCDEAKNKIENFNEMCIYGSSIVMTTFLFPSKSEFR